MRLVHFFFSLPLGDVLYTGLQVSIHAEVTLIIHFAIKHVIEAMTGKNRADTLFARFMNFAVSVFQGLVMFGVCQYGYRNINNPG